MANSISHASLPFPVKNARYTILVPFLDADGDPTDPTTPDTEVSIDAGSFADAAEEVTTITGSNGCGYVTLTGAETNGSAIALAFKVASGPKATLMTVNPRVLPVEQSGTAQAGAAGTITLASGASAIDDYYNGCIVKTTGGTGGGGTGGANNQARVITDYVGSTKVATISPNWETNPASDTTYEVLLTEMACNSLRALRPTVDQRTLDVSSGGEAGVDWANVGSPTTSVTLSSTTVGTATATTTVNGLAANVITAAATATDFGTEVAAAVWDKAMSAHVTAGTFGQRLQAVRTGTAQAGAAGTVTLDASASASDDFYKNSLVLITGGTGPNQVRTISGYVGSTKVASVTPNWVTTPSSDSVFLIIPNGAIAGATAPTAGEVADAVWDEAQSGHTSAGTFGRYLDAQVANVETDTQDIQSRLPAALVSGRIDSSVGAMASGVLTATAIAADAITAAKIADGAIDAATFAASAITATAIASDAITDAKVASDVTIASVTGAVGSVTGNVGGNVTGSVGSVASGGISEASFATTAGPFAPLNIVDQGTAQSATSTTVVLRSAAAFADSTLIGTRIAVLGSTQGYWQERAITANTLSNDTVTVAAWDVTPSGTITYKIFGDTAASGSAPSAATIADAVWDEARSGHVTSGSFGEYVNANITNSLGVAVTNSDGTAQAGASTSITLASGASSTTDYYKDQVIRIVAGTGISQSRVCTAYNGTTKVATVHEAWATNPSSDSQYVFEGNCDVNVERLSEDATAANNAESFFDGTGYAGTNNVIPLVTTTTTATNVTTVNGLAAGVITAASIASDAITDAKVASDVTIASVTGAVGSVTGNVGGNVTGSVGSVATGGITEASFATTAGSFAPLNVLDQGTAQAATSTTIRLRSAAAFADSELIGARVLITGGSAGVGQSRLITAYTSSTDTATVSTWTTTPTGTITYKIFGDTAAAGGSAPTAAEVADAVWDEAQSGHTTAGTFGRYLDGQVANVETDTQDIQSRLPAALVSGRIDSSVGAMAANTLTATAIAADAITAAKIADGAIDAATFAAGAINAAAIAADAITDAKVASDVTIASVTGSVGSVTGAVGSVTGNVGGNVTGSVGSVAAGGIAATSIATGAITAAKFAANAIDAAALATDAVTEIQSGLATAAALTTVDDFLDTEIAAIKAVTDKLDTALELDSTVYRFTLNALEQGPTGGGGVADWNSDERIAIRSILGIPASGQTPDDPTTGILDNIRDRVGTPAGASLAADVAAVKTDTGNLVARITSSLFSGITKLGGWLRLLARKDAAVATDEATSLSEINANGGSGAGAYVSTTDSQEAVRDRGDAAWTTATGFSTHSATDVWAAGTRTLTAGTNIALAKGTGVTGFNDLDAAGVRTAVGLASANLDTQLAAIVVDTNELQVDWVNGGRLDLLLDAVKAKTDILPASFPSNFASLTISVGGIVAADIQKINTIDVVGDGSVTKFGV